jgi:A/G-specific adenine glycosylase
MNRQSEILTKWYKKQNYSMPWRKYNTSYHIWISEIMLQQTKVNTVIKYYNTWMHNFKNIESIASSSIDNILKLWEGLGYYQRAHNIHETSKTIISKYNGKLPETYEELILLKGIGDYTASAILSISNNQSYPAIDGNLKRVIARLAGIDDFKNIVPKSKEYVSQLMDNYKPSIINQSIMDLGREICISKNPKCTICPLSSQCAAYIQKSISRYSLKSKHKVIPNYDVAVGMIWKDNQILISKRKKKGLLGGLWELPGGKLEAGEKYEDCLNRELREELNIDIKINKKIGIIKHKYSHFSINMTGYNCNLISGNPKPLASDLIKWINIDEISKYAFPKSTLKLFLLGGYTFE